MAISKTRKVKIMDAKYISPLQMYGPIVQPMVISESIVYDLVRKLYTVIEVNSNKEEVKLTVINFNSADRFKKEAGATTITTARSNTVKTPGADSIGYNIPDKVIPHTNTVITDNSTHENIKVPDNISLRAVEKNTITVPVVPNIPVPTSEVTSSEPIINEQKSISSAISLPTAVEVEALTADGASNDDVNDSVTIDDEGIDDEEEPEEDSDETSGDSSVTSTASSTSPSNKKRHNRGKKHK